MHESFLSFDCVGPTNPWSRLRVNLSLGDIYLVAGKEITLTLWILFHEYNVKCNSMKLKRFFRIEKKSIQSKCRFCSENTDYGL